MEKEEVRRPMTPPPPEEAAAPALDGAAPRAVAASSTNSHFSPSHDETTQVVMRASSSNRPNDDETIMKRRSTSNCSSSSSSRSRSRSRSRQDRLETEQDDQQQQQQQQQQPHHHHHHHPQQLQLPWEFMTSVSAASASFRSFYHSCCCCPNRTTTTTRTTRQSTNHHHNNHNTSKRTIWVFRGLFIGFLCVVAAGLGTGVYYIQYNSEQALATSQFVGLADRAIDSARSITHRKVLGSITMAKLYSTTFNDSKEWPYVHLDNFDDVSSDLLETSTGRGFIFAPIVQPGAELDEFEEWMKTKLPLITNDDDDGTITTTTTTAAGVSSFGYGVYSYDYSLNNTDKRYHDTTGETSWGSSNRIVTPITQVKTMNDDFSTTSSYLLNYHSIEPRGSSMDESIECSCGTLSDISSPFGVDDPGSVMMIPIIPAPTNSTKTNTNTTTTTTTVAGFVISPILWQSILDGAFNSKVSGIDVVLSTSGSNGSGNGNNGNTKHTYRIVDGIAQYRGPDDYHDPAYDEYHEMTMLTEGRAFRDLSSSSPAYYMHIYPSDEYFAVFSTYNPQYATVGTVLIIFLTSLLFFVYDALVMKENRKNHEIIEGRRRFIRFVSHEVRTPLNSVCMGLTLLRDELQSLFNDGSGQDAMSPHDTMVNSKASIDDIDGGGDTRTVVVQTTPDAVHDVMNLSKQIFTSASKAVGVLTDCLDYDKIETGRLRLEKTFLNIWDLLDQVIVEFQAPFNSKNVRLDVDWTGINLIIDEETGWPNDESTQNQCVIGDMAKITLVLRNLLSTSLEFTPEGGKVTVRPEWNECEGRGNGLLEEIQLSDDCDPQSAKSKNTKRQRSSTSLQDSDPENDFDRTECNRTGAFLRSGILKFSIADTSVGMSSDQIHSRLFSDGVQGEINREKTNQGSSGLGLFIAKGIMRGHGGDVMERSDGLHCGSSFVVTVPTYHVPSWRSESSDAIEATTLSGSRHSNISGLLSPAPRDNDCGHEKTFDLTKARGMVGDTSDQHSSSSSSSSGLSSVSAALSATTHSGKQPLRILVVDDVLTNRKLLSRLLEKKGHICDQAEDGNVAVTKVKKSWEEHLNDKQHSGTGSGLYDVILMDYEMPVMNGPTSVRTMKQQLPEYFISPQSRNKKKKNKTTNDKKRCVVIGVTGNVLPEDVAWFKKCGAEHVLPKPLEMALLNKLLIDEGILLASPPPSPSSSSISPPLAMPPLSSSAAP